MVVKILRGMAERYGVISHFPTNSVFEAIYDYTERYIPANAQPRKSILVFDNMLGWYKFKGRRLDKRLLGDVIFETEGINVAFRVDASSIKKRLNSAVFAQDLATSIIESRLNVCVADLNNKSKPMSSFLFCGSTGVGKTEMTKQLALILFNDVRRLIRFDMSEYSSSDSLERFRTSLTQAVWERPYSIILLDEIEKADGAITRLLLQVLDDGRLIDANNREVTFVNSYIILTTNAGSEIFKNISQYDVSDVGDGSNLKKYERNIRKSLASTNDGKFPAELLGRIDCIVPFQPLSLNTHQRILENRMRKVKEDVMSKYNIDVVYDKSVRDYIMSDLDVVSDSGGARTTIAKFESDVLSQIAAFLNKHLSDKLKRIYVECQGILRTDSKNNLENDAKIVVRAIRS